jgi:hypothetical protein
LNKDCENRSQGEPWLLNKHNVRYWIVESTGPFL